MKTYRKSQNSIFLLRMRTAILAAVLALLLCGADAAKAVIVVEPDAFPAGTNISNAFDGVTLSALGSTPVTSSVFSLTCTFSSTGTQVFGHDGRWDIYWGLVSSSSFDASLRADFDSPANFVSIDFIPNDGYDPGVLQAFNSMGVLLETVTTPGTSGVGSVETATISRATPDIAYVIASAPQGTDVHLDHVVFVPEPGTVLLLGLGCLAVARKRGRQEHKSISSLAN